MPKYSNSGFQRIIERILPWGIVAFVFQVFWSHLGGASGLHSPIATLAMLSFFQWLMIIPHELGHAVAARLLGGQKIRIMIGSGFPVWSGSFLRFTWMINRVPFSGLTLSTHKNPPVRWKSVLRIAAGPAVSLGAGIMILWFTWDNGRVRIPSITTVPGSFFWANAIVLLNNIIPHYFSSSVGHFPNDGMQIATLLMPKWFKAGVAAETTGAGRIYYRLIHVTGAVLLGGVALTFAYLAFQLFGPYQEMGGNRAARLGLLFAGNAVFCGYLSYRIARQFFELGSEPPQRAYIRGILEIRAESRAEKIPEIKRELAALKRPLEPAALLEFAEKHLEDYFNDSWLLLLKAQAQLQLKQPQAAEQTLAGINARGKLSEFAIAMLNLQTMLDRDLMDEAEAFVEKFLGENHTVAEKTEICDQLVCLPLYDGKNHYAARLEKWIHRAIALAPNYETLRASLAGVWVEQGRFSEAEPILLSLLDSGVKLNDRGISMFYLAIVRIAGGKDREAKMLLEHAMTLHEVPWLSARARKLLQEIDESAAVKTELSRPLISGAAK
jgi:hypothetical protein